MDDEDRDPQLPELDKGTAIELILLLLFFVIIFAVILNMISIIAFNGDNNHSSGQYKVFGILSYIHFIGTLGINFVINLVKITT